MVDVGLPWLNQVNSGGALAREAALNPEYWRTIGRENRARLPELIDEVILGTVSQPRFELGTKGSTSVQEEIPNGVANQYVQVEQQYVSKTDPSLRGTITFLKRNARRLM